MMRILCDSPISIDEVKDSILQLKNKSPGSDGITAEFYKLYSELLSPFLLQVYTESLNCSELSVSMKQGVICLIPKPKKDTLLLDNWRPVSLLNNDYKLFALIFSKRFKLVLNSIIDENQSGFMKNRHIFNNIRLVFDLIDYSELIEDDILFLDVFKAFDTIEHPFIFFLFRAFWFRTVFM